MSGVSVGQPALPFSADANPEQAKIASFPAFDWLRFVLASVVVIGHHGFVIAPPIDGSLAVDVFFVLSGWLIGGILLRTRTADLPRFYFNRATRIWIPYAVAILLFYGAALLREGAGFFWFKYLFLDVTFTHNLWTIFPRAALEMPLKGSANQFWSISVEEQFYLLAPLVILLARFGRSALVWAAISIVAFALGVFGAPIALGVTAAIARETHGWRIGRTSWLVIAGLALIALTAMLMIANPNHPLKGLFALCVVLLTSGEGVRSTVAVLFGGLSFPLYLNHWIGIFAVHLVEKQVMLLPQWLVITSAYLLNVAIAAALYWLIDRRIQQRRQRHYSDGRGRALAATAYALVAIGFVGGWMLNRVGPHGVDPRTGMVASADGDAFWQGQWP